MEISKDGEDIVTHWWKDDQWRLAHVILEVGCGWMKEKLRRFFSLSGSGIELGRIKRRGNATDTSWWQLQKGKYVPSHGTQRQAGWQSFLLTHQTLHAVSIGGRYERLLDFYNRVKLNEAPRGKATTVFVHCADLQRSGMEIIRFALKERYTTCFQRENMSNALHIQHHHGAKKINRFVPEIHGHWLLELDMKPTPKTSLSNKKFDGL